MFIRPDWREPKAYDFLKKSISAPGGNILAWEFLRRNPSYAADSEKYELDIRAWFNGFLRDHPTYAELESHHSEIEIFEIYAESNPDGRQRWRDHFHNTWGIATGIRPEDDHAPDFFVDIYLDSPHLFKLIEDAPMTGPYVLIPVDLEEPLEALLRNVEKEIRALRNAGIRQKVVKPRTERVRSSAVYINQLRILDGLAAKATVTEIGNVLAPNDANEEGQRDKRLKAAHEAARKMQDGGYRVLL